MVELGFFVGAFVLVGVGYVCGRRENNLAARGNPAVPSHIRDVWSLWDTHKAHEASKKKVNRWQDPASHGTPIRGKRKSGFEKFFSDIDKFCEHLEAAGEIKVIEYKICVEGSEDGG